MLTPWKESYAQPRQHIEKQRHHFVNKGLSTQGYGLSSMDVSSVQFSCSVMSDSLWPREPQHARPPCPSPTSGVGTNSCPSSQWCHPAISSPLLLPSIFPSMRVFSNESVLLIRWPKYWSFSFNIILPLNTKGWSPLGWTCWISLKSKELKSLLQHHSSKASILWHSAFLTVQLSHPYMTTGKTIALTRRTLFPLWGINSVPLH